MVKKVFITLFSIIGALLCLLITLRGAFGNTSEKITINGILDLFNGFDLRVPLKYLISTFNNITDGFKWNPDVSLFDNIFDVIRAGFNSLLLPLQLVVAIIRFFAYIWSWVINVFIYLLGFNPIY